MQVKRYIAADMRQALKEIREDLGPDAIILSNRPVKGGIEILATLDEKVSEMFAAQISAPKSAPAERESLHIAVDDTPNINAELPLDLAANPQEFAQQAAPINKAAEERIQINLVNATPSRRKSQSSFGADGVDEFSDMDNASIREELRAVRAMLEQQSNALAWGDYRRQHPMKAIMWRKLQRLGIHSSLGDDLLRDMPESLDQKQVWRGLMSNLSQRVQTAPWDLLQRDGVYAFVGPTGVGKTTTIAKLAARYVMAHGNEDLALISLDSYRIGSFEQLKVLGRILDVPVRFVTDIRGLADALAQCKQKRMIMIDTAGLTRQHPQLEAQLHELNKLGHSVQTIQVHAATAQYAYMKNAYQTYKTNNLAGCVLTKLDEAFSFGEAINLLAETKMPLLYTSNGQAIPNDLMAGNGRELIKSAIRLAKSAPTEELQIADQFGEHLRRQRAG